MQILSQDDMDYVMERVEQSFKALESINYQIHFISPINIQEMMERFREVLDVFEEGLALRLDVAKWILAMCDICREAAFREDQGNASMMFLELESPL